MGTRKPKVLHCITAYNGETIVPRAIHSALAMDQTVADIDILILDDCSPQPGFSERIRTLCAELGINYYRTPRNLGIPRNCSLGLLAGLKNGYDFVTINNSDTIFSRSVISELVKAYRANPNVGSVTAWSNNVSIYSIPNKDPDHFLGTQERTDWFANIVSGLYSGRVIDIPAGISFCILIPTDVIADVGINDPVFGRGYCEETDWSLRSLAAGYRICLAPGAFTYHQGRGSNLTAGLVTGDQTTVPENEAIIDMRYPNFRSQCDIFISANPLPKMHRDVARAVIDAGLKDVGYEINICSPDLDVADDAVVSLNFNPHSDGGSGTLSYFGFQDQVSFSLSDIGASIKSTFGKVPVRINAYDRSALVSTLRESFSESYALTRRNYPSLV
ncbi:glycosyltransferase family 2 protein [Asticcacaulis taihuensis]|uniref:Glycosyltransferase, GT2 family n=1 Tax=Asticcacaulis taihuensis TaxID=260084 RepID=A0A1G4SEI1_9CAUL|nr:glycosyltransferase [Asticcacaulis taihuensis]SCW67593.1 Glycosyltransferase, GT2 family [Asticcacaulis taihuensis]